MSVGINKKGDIISMPAVYRETGFRSKAVEDIISGQPDFLSRFAVFFFVLILALFLIASCFIRYAKNINVAALIVPITEQHIIDSITGGDEKNINLKTEVPGNSGKSNGGFYAYGVIKNIDIQQIKTGQQAILDFPIYPVQDFGAVAGYVESLSAIQGTSDYTIKIKLPDGLKTTQNKHLPYLIGLNVNIQINTKSMSLFTYFFNKN